MHVHLNAETTSHSACQMALCAVPLQAKQLDAWSAAMMLNMFYKYPRSALLVRLRTKAAAAQEAANVAGVGGVGVAGSTQGDAAASEPLQNQHNTQEGSSMQA